MQTKTDRCRQRSTDADTNGRTENSETDRGQRQTQNYRQTEIEMDYQINGNEK